MRWLILACLAIFCAERLWLLNSVRCNNLFEGLGLLFMAKGSIAALVWYVMSTWWT
jgi:hypothetical protein